MNVAGLFARGVSGVTLLPEKFECAQEEFRAQLPAHHAIPLIHEHWEIAIRLNPFRPHVPDYGFGCGANDQRFRQLFASKGLALQAWDKARTDWVTLRQYADVGTG